MKYFLMMILLSTVGFAQDSQKPQTYKDELGMYGVPPNERPHPSYETTTAEEPIRYQPKGWHFIQVEEPNGKWHTCRIVGYETLNVSLSEEGAAFILCRRYAPKKGFWKRIFGRKTTDLY